VREGEDEADHAVGEEADSGEYWQDQSVEQI